MFRTSAIAAPAYPLRTETLIVAAPVGSSKTDRSVTVRTFPAGEVRAQPLASEVTFTSEGTDTKRCAAIRPGAIRTYVQAEVVVILTSSRAIVGTVEAGAPRAGRAAADPIRSTTKSSFRLDMKENSPAVDVILISTR